MAHISVRYPTPTCVVAELQDCRILFDPSLPDPDDSKALSWTGVDVILVSNYSKALAVVYVLQYSLFEGLVLATQPTIDFMRLLALEYVCRQKCMGQVPLFNEFDVEDSLGRITPIFYNSAKSVSTNVHITATSSGLHLGGANWLVSYGSIEMSFVSAWSAASHPYCRLMDTESLSGKDLLVTTTPVSVKKIVYNKKLIDLWPMIGKSAGANHAETMFKNRGTIIFPTPSIQDLFELVETVFNLLDSSGIKWPIHILSKTGKQAILQSGVLSEWMNRQRQAIASQARQPLLVGALLEKKHILCYDTPKDIFADDQPRLVVCTQEYDLVSLYESLPNACIVLSDSRFKVPSSGVFYYDQADRLETDNIKGLLSLLKPKAFCLDPTDFHIAMDYECTLPWDIVKQTRHGPQQYIPIHGHFDLASNRISL
ncbi:Integrator complex subunit 9 [Kappamyces sp. JEL0829]|nr:Integrator complex subunit 9 [Kappamyces sp. JEL0829]